MQATRYPLTRALNLSPWRDINTLSNRLGRLWDESVVDGANGATWHPGFDIVENGDAFVLHADLPGMSVDDVTIEFRENVLSVAGERTETPVTDSDVRIFTGRAWGRFHRTFSLPGSVDADGITAQFDNGVLSIYVPKAPEAKGRRIEIQTSA